MTFRLSARICSCAIIEHREEQLAYQLWPDVLAKDLHQTVSAMTEIVEPSDYPATPEDVQICTRARQLMESSEGLRPEWVSLRADHGIIELLGSVPSREARTSLWALIKRIQGVVEVHDHLELRTRREVH